MHAAETAAHAPGFSYPPTQSLARALKPLLLGPFFIHLLFARLEVVGCSLSSIRDYAK